MITETAQEIKLLGLTPPEIFWIIIMALLFLTVLGVVAMLTKYNFSLFGIAKFDYDGDRKNG